MSTTSEPTNNKTVAVLRGQQIVCDTEEGAAYVTKTTHPPSIIPVAYKGVPDASAPNVTLLELKGESNIPPILTRGITATTTQTYNSSNLLFLQTSSLNVGSYVFQGSGLGWTQAQTKSINGTISPAINQICPTSANTTGYNFSNFVDDAAMFRPTYKSATYYLNATDFNNQGTVTTAKFKPNVIFTNALTQFEHCKKNINSVRSLINFLPREAFNTDSDFERAKSWLTDDPDIEILHIDTKKKNLRKELTLDDFHLMLDGSFTFQCWDVGAAGNGSVTPGQFDSMFSFSILPLNAGEVLKLSPKAISRPAKEGAFVVQQPINQTIQNWTPVADETNANISAQANKGLVMSGIRYIPPSGGFVFIPLYSSQQTTNTVAANVTYVDTLSTPWNNLDWSLTLFEGMTMPAAVGTSLSSVPYVTCKTYVGFEAQNNVNSSWAPFQDLLAPPDNSALLMANGIHYKRPDSLPASANDLASIGGTILQFLPTAIGWLKDLFSPKPSVAEVKKEVKNEVKKSEVKSNAQRPRYPMRNPYDVTIAKKNKPLPKIPLPKRVPPPPPKRSRIPVYKPLRSNQQAQPRNAGTAIKNGKVK